MLHRFFTLLFVVLIISAVCLVGCGEEQVESEVAGDTTGVVDSAYSQYGDWIDYTYQHIRLHYPPAHPRESLIHDVAVSFEAALDRDSRFLGVLKPTEPIDIYYYTGFGQGRQYTGRQYPFVTDTAIHYWHPSFYGPVIARYMLRSYSEVEPRHEFIRQGIIALLDFSGQNYHQMTLDLIEKGEFIPLDSLARDTSTNVDKERKQSAEAASFVDFLVYSAGPEALKGMYETQLSFDSAVKAMFRISVDSVQTLWLKVADQGAALTKQDTAAAE